MTFHKSPPHSVYATRQRSCNSITFCIYKLHLHSFLLLKCAAAIIKLSAFAARRWCRGVDPGTCPGPSTRKPQKYTTNSSRERGSSQTNKQHFSSCWNFPECAVSSRYNLVRRRQWLISVLWPPSPSNLFPPSLRGTKKFHMCNERWHTADKNAAENGPTLTWRE